MNIVREIMIMNIVYFYMVLGFKVVDFGRFYFINDFYKVGIVSEIIIM